MFMVKLRYGVSEVKVQTVILRRPGVHGGGRGLLHLC